MDPALVEQARRRVNRAQGILKDAVAELAALADGIEPFGALRVHDRRTLREAQELVSLAHDRCGVVDVIVVRRHSSKPTTAQQSKGENHASDPQAVRAA